MASKVEKLKQQMAKATSKSESKPSPADGGPMGGTTSDVRGEGTKDKDVAAGPKSLADKQVAAEAKIVDAKAMDQEDTREETSGDERHDLISGKELNIPPTIVQERLKNNQNPSTGEPWTKEERLQYDRDREDERRIHARAVKESEERMRREQAEVATPIQPVPHVPMSQLTETQKKAMQDAQDAGKGPIAQAAARDINSPEEIGRREAEEDSLAAERHRTEREEAGIDEDIEKTELGEDVDDGDDDGEGDKDADEVQADLDRLGSDK